MQLPPESIKLGNLRYLATMYAESVTPDSEIRKEDVTPFFVKYILDTLRKRHLINIQITGQVTEGKSTLMFQILLFVLQHLKVKMDIFNIAGDQIEGLRKIANPETHDTCIGIDEWNKLSTTGLNSSTDAASFEYYSDVQAQRYINKISCSPLTIVDPNADVVLQVVSVDQEAQRTICILSYRLVRPNMDVFFQPIGIVSICVSQALRHPVYKEYRTKKFAKMDLVSREGVRDVRELEHARVTMEVYRMLEPLSAVTPISRDICGVYVKVIRSKYRELFSILTMDDITKDAHGLLKMRSDLFELRRKAKSPSSKLTDEERTTLISELSKLETTLEIGLAHYQRLINVYDRYSKI